MCPEIEVYLRASMFGSEVILPKIISVSVPYNVQSVRERMRLFVINRLILVYLSIIYIYNQFYARMLIGHIRRKSLTDFLSVNDKSQFAF